MSVGGNFYSKSDDCLNELFLTDPNSFEESDYLSEHDKLENMALTVVNQYLSVTHPDLKGTDQQNIRNNVKESFIKLIKKQNMVGSLANDKLNLSDILDRLAFFRLVEICKKYYFVKFSNPNSQKLADFKEIVNERKKEYGLIISISGTDDVFI